MILDLDILNKFIKEQDLELELPCDDTLLLRIETSKLETVTAFLLGHRAQFQAQVVSKKANRLELKYFFYIGIKSKLLVLELNTEYTRHPSIPSITAYYPAVYVYEQETRLKFGIEYCDSIEVKFPYDPAPEFEPNDPNTTEIPVGPIHAGVIEPGHFHFTCHGEHIVNLSISLGYLHKNIETEFENRSIEEGLELSNSICGDSIVAYSLAYVQALEKIQSITVNKRTQYHRIILLELERLYNHIGDIGGIINDSGFSITNSHLSAIKERMLRLNKKIFGHRFLSGSINIGSVSKDLGLTDIEILNDKLNELNQDFKKAINLTMKHKTVLDRFSQTGYLTNATAQLLSVAGIVGKASGVSFDSRRDLSFATYEDINFHTHVRREGDVYARFQLRLSEVEESFKIIRQCLRKLSSDENEPAEAKLTRKSAWSVVESARGPVFAYLELDNKAKIARAKLRDISKHNWKALEYAVLKNIVPDFPLCNKSFSLAYAATDM